MKHMVLSNVVPDYPADTRNNPRGVICLANEERFTAAFFSEPLSTYAIGWKDPENIQATLDGIAPPVEVPRRFEYKSAVNIEEFLSEVDDIRAIGSSFKKVEFTGTSVNQKTLNKGLTVTLDRDELVPGKEERTVIRLISRLNRNDLRRAVAALIASASNTGKTWDGTAGKDPDMDVKTDLETGATERGIGDNVIVYGATAWTKRLACLRAQNLAGQARSSTLSQDELAGFLGVDRIVQSKERYQSTKTAKAEVVGAYVLMYYASLLADQEDPSNIKQFWTPTESGRFRVYREEHAKTIDISVEHYSNIVLPSTLGLRKFTIS
ncbi:MAG: hypothetical protein NT011_13500 [Kiritimatiellaeota bacterium]|nr:hypothetical protein [Kiritimatiellota bacterium]